MLMNMIKMIMLNIFMTERHHNARNFPLSKMAHLDMFQNWQYWIEILVLPIKKERKKDDFVK